MNVRTRLANWSLPVLLLAVPVCATLALEHASATGMKERSRNHPQQIEAIRPKPAAPAASLPANPESPQPESPKPRRS